MLDYGDIFKGLIPDEWYNSTELVKLNINQDIVVKGS
jgi:hypothetical protein